jgi:hypothetical protein
VVERKNQQRGLNTILACGGFQQERIVLAVCFWR